MYSPAALISGCFRVLPGKEHGKKRLRSYTPWDSPVVGSTDCTLGCRDADGDGAEDVCGYGSERVAASACDAAGSGAGQAYRGALCSKVAAPVGVGPLHFRLVRDDRLFLVESIPLAQRIQR